MHGLMYSMRSTITVVGDAFLLLREGDHRALDSFPTRRSSDLATCARRWLAERPAGQQADDGTEEHDAEEVFHFQFRISGRSRSEEHTSELQSHHDLVCRLLLEKKNSSSMSTQSVPSSRTPHAV